MASYLICLGTSFVLRLAKMFLCELLFILVPIYRPIAMSDYKQIHVVAI